MNLSARSHVLAGGVILLGIAGQWWGEGAEHLWRLPAAALVLALIFERLHIGRLALQLERELPATMILGEPAVGRLTLDNPDPVSPLRVEAMPYYSGGLEGKQTLFRWQLAPGQTQDREFSVTPVALGDAPWGPLHVRVLGPLGLAWWGRKLESDEQTRVLPDHAHHLPQTAGTRGGGERRAGVARHGNELLYLREYQPGDPLRNVDWKATARLDKPIVRVYAEEQHLELLLVLDAGRNSRIQAGNLTRLHHYVNIAARLGETAMLHGDRVGLVSFAEGPLDVVPPGRGNTCLARIRHSLGRLGSQPAESNPLAAAMEVRRLLRQRGLVVWLTDLEEQEAARQLLQAANLLLPKHLPLIASPLDEEIAALRHQPARHWLDPYHNYAALEAFASIRHTANQLKRMGGIPVLARPGQLDAAVFEQYARLRQRRRV